MKKGLIIGIIIGLVVIGFLLFVTLYLIPTALYVKGTTTPGIIQETEQEQIRCVVGELEGMQLSEGLGFYGGEVKGIENVQLSGGAGSTNLCCSDGEAGGKQLKLCTKAVEGLITHEVVFEKVGSNYVKVDEKIKQEINGQSVTCDYQFDNSGSVASRGCF